MSVDVSCTFHPCLMLQGSHDAAARGCSAHASASWSAQAQIESLHVELCDTDLSSLDSMIVACRLRLQLQQHDPHQFPRRSGQLRKCACRHLEGRWPSSYCSPLQWGSCFSLPCTSAVRGCPGRGASVRRPETSSMLGCLLDSTVGVEQVHIAKRSATFQ